MNEKFGVDLEISFVKFKEQLQKSLSEIDSWAKKMTEKAKISPQFNFISDLVPTKFSDDMKMQKFTNELLIAEMEADSLHGKFNELAKEVKEFPKNKQDGEEYSKLISKLNKTEIALTKAGNKVDELYSKIENRKLELDNFEEMNEKINKINKNTTNGFSGGLKSIKRFTLSLFSLHSAWSLLSRSASSYLAMNEELNASSQLISNTLGVTLAPAIEKVVDIGQYGVIIFAKLVEFFTGYNSLTKVTTNNINNMNKASKSLNKTLASFDEIQNLDTSNNLSSSIQTDLNALNDFYEKVDEVTQKFNEWEKTNLAQSLKSAVDWFKDLDDGMKATLITSGLLLKSLGKGSGLLGTLGLLVASPFVITLTYKGVNELKNELDKLEEEIQAFKDTSTSTGNAWKKTSDLMIEKIKDGTLEVDTLKMGIDSLKQSIERNEKSVESTKELNDNVGFLEGIMTNNKAAYREMIETVVDKNEVYINSLYKIYEALDFEADGVDVLVESMKTQIENIEATNYVYEKNSEEYKTNIKRIEELKNKINILTTKDLENQIKKLEDSNNTLEKNSAEYSNNIKKIDELKTKLKKLDGTKSKTTIDLDMDTSKARKNYSNFFTKLGESFSALFTGNTYSNGFFKTMKNIWSLDVGTNYVPNDHLAMVHKGEAVIPAKYNPTASGMSGNSSDIVNAIEKLISVVEDKEFTSNITGSLIGKTSQNYINNKSRIIGKQVI